MVSKIRGQFERFQGQIVTAADPRRSSAALTAEMNPVNTGNQTRDDDLRSDNFLTVAANSVMTHRSTGIHPRRRGPRHRRQADRPPRHPAGLTELPCQRVRR